MVKFVNFFFYSNFYLGLCATTLCLETTLITGLPLNNFSFYLIIFFCTLIYYTRIYVRSVSTKNSNERTVWYSKNLVAIKTSLRLAFFFVIILLLIYIVTNLAQILSLTLWQVLLIATFPFAAGWYTFTPRFLRVAKIRQTGRIKPFVVALTWAGWVTIYPVIGCHIERNQSFEGLIIPLTLLALQNFLFFSINAIIFDIKDCRTDQYFKLKTYPVVLGVQNTFRFVLWPLILINLVVFFLFQHQQDFTLPQTLIQLIPYLMLVFVVVGYRHGRRVLYYLAAVDGLVFLKALCGIISIVIIKK